MDGANDREVPPIERGDAMDTEALGDRDDRRVSTAEAKIGIALGEVGHTNDVSVGQLGQPQATRRKSRRNRTSASGPPHSLRR